MKVDAGFIAQEWVQGGEAWWASRDGTDWSPMDLSELDLAIGQADFNFSEVGDTAFVAIEDEAGRRDMWILSFDTVPGAPTPT